MKNGLVIGAILLCAALLPNVGLAQEQEIDEVISVKHRLWAPAQASRARESLIEVNLGITVRFPAGHKVCEAPFEVKVTYEAKPSDPDSFKNVPRVSVGDLTFLPKTYELRRALTEAGKPSMFSFEQTGELQFTVRPRVNSKFTNDAKFEVYNRIDGDPMASFNVYFCLDSDFRE